MVSKEVQALVAKVNKKLGEGAVVVGSDIKIARRFTSGSLGLDVALGGGWPANHWIEVIGQESHGKTAIVLKTIAANMAVDPEFTVFWLAAEHYDTDQAEALGVDNDRVIVHSTQAMEDALQTVLEFADSRAVDCIVIDSYPALIPNEEADKEMDGAVMALGARALGKFFRKAGSATRRSLTDDSDRPLLCFMINQFRDAIGQFSPHGTPKTTPGGKAKNYAFYVRVEVKRDEWKEVSRLGKGKIKVGQTIKVNTIKNKSAAPQQVAAVDFYFRDAPELGFNRGEYDSVKEIVAMGLVFDVIARGGAYFQFDNGQYDEKGKPIYRWMGKPAMEEAIKGDLTLQAEVRAAVMEAVSKVGEAHSISEEDVDAALTAGTQTIVRKSATTPAPADEPEAVAA